jgi:hypothetical protein
MKNLRMFFGAIAFVLGISGVLASHFSPLVASYRQIFNGTELEECKVVASCNTQSEILCRFKIDNTPTYVPLFSINDVEQQCGPQLTHSLNDGVVNP